MRRTLVQLDDETYRKLRQRAFREERSISSVVRELLATGLEGNTSRTRLTRVSQLSSVGAGRSKQGALSPVSEQHDAALAAVSKR
jgi:plasmid stability protein